MDLLVSQTGPASAGVLRCGDAEYPCALGRSGVRADKREGDGATPEGCFVMRRVLYRADKIAKPATGLAVVSLDRADGWCDDASDKFYNRQVRLPYRARCENLWRSDGLYDVIIVLGHNDAPAVPGMGSAIFLHVAGHITGADLAPTEGCVALKLEDLLAVLHHAKPGDRLCVTTGDPNSSRD